MTHPALTAFLDRMDRLVAEQTDPAVIATATGRHLGELLAQPSFLDERFRRVDATAYAQHVVHVHPRGRYSIVALVWLPGQSTPIHNHICWCVVGVLQGREREISYDHRQDGVGDWLSVRDERVHHEGDICCLVPPIDDIHRVENPTDGVAISIHVYGADIGVLGTSINQRYSCQIRPATV